MGPVGLLLPERQDGFIEVFASLDARSVLPGFDHLHHRSCAIGVADTTVKIKAQSVGDQVVRTLSHRQVDGLVVLGLCFL